MATYNWTYKGGVVITYGLNNSLSTTITASADDVRPTNACYAALSGNDVTGNGSRIKPYKTFNKGMSVLASNQVMVLSAGVYRERYTGGNSNILVVADGDVTLEGTTLLNPCDGRQHFIDMKIRGYNGMNYNSGFKNCTISDMANGGDLDGFNNSVIYNTFERIGSMLLFPRPTQINSFKNNTFVDCVMIAITNNTLKFAYFNCIFYKCNLVFAQNSAITFCLFYLCNFRFNSNYNSNPPTVLYPSVPFSYTYISTIEALRLANETAVGVSLLNFQNCQIADIKFNNYTTKDYSLAFDSPAKNFSYLGTYIGSKSIGYTIKASATEASGDFDFSTAVNVTIANNSITMTNRTLPSIIETNCKPNLIQRAFSKVSLQGFNADRNGQYIDSIKDLSATTTSAGTNLVENTPYIVEVASITYNGAVILAGERFTTTAVLTFTSAGGGICREITEAPQRHTIEARFSDGGATKNVGDALTVGYWYYVSGTITYNGVDYTNRTFKAIDTNSFTGAGILMEALTTQAYQHYEIGIPFTSNNVGDARTGAIVRGNGDPAYERGTTKEFPINARFAQIKFTIQPNNLKP